MIILISLVIGLILLAGTAMLFYRRSWKVIHLLFLFAGLFAVNLIAGDDSLHLAISLVIIGASAGYTFRNNKKLLSFIFVSSLSITFIFTFNHYYLKNIKNIDILKDSKDRLIDILKESSVPDSERKLITQRLDESLTIIADIIPFAYFLNSLLLSLMGLFFLKYLYRRFYRNEKKEEINIEGIERFKIKEYLIFIFIAGWFIVLLVDRSGNYFLYIAGLNAALIFSCFYLIQAFGIIKYLLAKKGLSISLLPLLMLSFLFLGIEYFLFILIIISSIGALDFWADFRKLEPEGKKS